MSDPRFLQDGFDKRLSHLIEECGEVSIEIGGTVAAAGKLQRWGPYSVNPLLAPEDQETNIAWLQRKMGDLRREMTDLAQALDRLDTAISDEVRNGHQG